MQQINFSKLSGAGNDFIIIDNRKNIVPSDLTKFIEKICVRRISVGADGVLLVENSDIADFKMRYFNSDGSEAETCGNGARCIAKFAYSEGVVKSEKMTFETKAGIYSAEIIDKNVKIKMSNTIDMKLNFPIKLNDETFTISFANSGVPHAVFVVDDLEKIDVIKLGKETRYHEDFSPKGTNVNFIKIRDKNNIDIRTYERGVEDETLACGTGSIASAVIASALGLAESPVTMHTWGKFELKIYFTLQTDGATDVYLEGDARIVYKGYLTEDAWNY
ncbi:MAG: diaminopimelate epimerase [Candidatus Poribacteria bacterium]